MIFQGLQGGYCYVYASRAAPNGTTECKCFEELLQSNQWERIIASHTWHYHIFYLIAKMFLLISF